MRNIIHLFFRAEGINPWTVLVCLVAASVVEGLGFASLVPLLWIVADPEQAAPSPVLDVSRDIMAKLGLSLDIGTLLVFFIATLVLRSALTFVAMRHVGYAVAEFSTGLRSRIIEHLFRARWGFLVQHRVGRAASAISCESGRAGRHTTWRLRSLLSSSRRLPIWWWHSWCRGRLRSRPSGSAG